MNDEDALSFFNGRKPSFSFTKNGPVVRGARSRRGAPLAQPPQGLTSGSNATSAVDWVSKFNNTGSQVLGAAMAELGIGGNPAMGAAGPADGGIAGQTLDTMFGPGYWNRLLGRRPAPSAAPALYTPAPFMTGGTAAPRGGGVRPEEKWQSLTQTGFDSKYITPGTDPYATFVPGQNTAANLAKRRAPFGWSSAFSKG